MFENERLSWKAWLVMFVIGLCFLAIFLEMGRATIGSWIYADTIQEHAESATQEWVEQMYPTAGEDVNMVCQSVDTDDNGYVTCAASVGDERVNLECYAWIWFNPGNNGCREVMPLRTY